MHYVWGGLPGFWNISRSTIMAEIQLNAYCLLIVKKMTLITL